MARTTLNSEDLELYADLLQTAFEHESFETYYHPLGVTIVAIDEFKGSNMRKVAFSFASSAEEKLSRHVGEYNALYRLLCSRNYSIFPAVIPLDEIGDNLARWL